MPATENVRQLPQSHNSKVEVLTPRCGVVTLFGYDIQVRVNRGHLVLEDGLAASRRYGRFPRVGHSLQRLVVVGSLTDVRALPDRVHSIGPVLFLPKSRHAMLSRLAYLSESLWPPVFAAASTV